MLILRIKQAECALADGRLEEAAEIIQSREVREHRRGQELAGQVARALVARAKRHLETGQLNLASADCDRAARVAGSLPAIAEIRAAVIEEMLKQKQAKAAAAQAAAAVQRQIERGQLSIGQRLLDEIQEPDAQAAALARDLAARRVVIDEVVEKVAGALKEEDWEGAIKELLAAREARVSDSRLRELTARTARLVATQAQTAIEAGRLDRASMLLKRLAKIEDGSVESEGVRRTLGQCQAALAELQAGRPREAERIMRRLAAVLPDAGWVSAALKHLQQACAATDELVAGPLGLLDDGSPAEAATMLPEQSEHVDRRMEPKAVIPLEAPGAVGSRFVVQVDGVGSFLVWRERRVTLGALSSTPAPDVAFLTDAQTPPLVIERIEDDYFLELPLAGGECGRRGSLLTNGQRITVTPRCRMTFRLPSAASGTAVLELNSARLGRADIRHVVLMDRELIIGAGADAHIRADEMTERAVLHVKDGQLCCQTKDEIRIEEQPASRGCAIPMGRHIRVGTVTFVVTRG